MLIAEEFSWSVEVATFAVASIRAACDTARTIVDKFVAIGRKEGIGSVERGADGIGDGA